MINIIIYQQIMIKTLIVDDNLSFVKNILNTVLNKFDNINISHIATSGEEALNIISTNNIDLIFLDLKLPDFDGIELIKKIAVLNTIKFPKIIVISGELSLLGNFIHSGYISNVINKVDSTESIYNSIKETINEINYLNNKEDIKNKVLSEL
ncbi:MAG: response regulator, partial [Clostridia bacterium]|nr:response regulator [Clostridia bacterium]